MLFLPLSILWLDYTKTVCVYLTIITIQLLDFLSTIQITIWLPDKNSGNWMFQVTKCLLYN